MAQVKAERGAGRLVSAGTLLGAVNGRRYKHNPLHPQGLGEGNSAPCGGAAGAELSFGNQELGTSRKIKIQGRGKVHSPDGFIAEMMGRASP